MIRNFNVEIRYAHIKKSSYAATKNLKKDKYKYLKIK
jgi:hypothetical protein